MNKSKKAGFYPILINLQTFRCLVVGGGRVAHRKILSLLKFGADITVISPRNINPIVKLAKNKSIKLILKPFDEKEIDGFGIVFSATDIPEINRMVRETCTKKGILLNVVDDPDLCDFILPANVIRGDLTLSISSRGKAPFLTKEMKKKIDGLIPPVYKNIFGMAGLLRKRISTNKNIDKKTRAKILKEFAARNWEKVLTGNLKKSTGIQLKEFLDEVKIK